jgi:hypothetical protein
MDPTGLIPIFILFALVAVAARFLAGAFDGDRVEAYIRDMGGELLDKSWDPLGPGWFGEKDSRIYAIMYRDRLGNVHRAHVKTSMLSGVYLTNDQIISERLPEETASEAGRRAYTPEAVEQEKERLRKRLAELEDLSKDHEPRTERLG